MHIGIGSHRVAIITSSLTIKIPRILRPFHYLKIMYELFRKRKFRLAWIDTRFTFSIFTQGISENWNEFKCWRRLRADFLIPTYFSIFGLLNFQKSSQGRELNYEEVVQIWIKIASKTEGEIWKTDYHIFANGGNFHMFEGEGIKILDYGGTRKFICKWHKLFSEVLLK